MIPTVWLLQSLMLAQVLGPSTRDAPLDRYGATTSSQETDSADVVPDSRPLLPPAGSIDRGPLQDGRGAAALGSTVESSPPRTVPPNVATQPDAVSPNLVPPRPKRSDVRQPPRNISPPTGSPFRDARPSTSGRNDQQFSARQWITELLAQPAEGALVGRPISLIDALRGIRDETRQRAIIDAYWRLSRSVANYHVAVQVLNAVEDKTMRPGLAAGRPDFAGGLRLDAARSKLAAFEAQADLAALIEWSEDAFPLPASPPHVGTYRTRYDEIFESRPNRPALRLHLLLPAQADVLRAHAEMLNALASSGEGQVAESFREQCREFLDDIYEYNRNIAHYVLLATNDSDGADLVPMLIRVERTKTNSSDIASNVVPTLATQDPDESSVERSVLVVPGEETNLVPVRGDSAGSKADAQRQERQPEGVPMAQPGRWQRR